MLRRKRFRYPNGIPRVESEQQMPATPLRERIAKVLYERTMSKSEWARPWKALYPAMQQLWLNDADAVIAELGLRLEWGALDDTDSGTLADTREELEPWQCETIKVRLVTEWAADE
jgi:hypothetical protein